MSNQVLSNESTWWVFRGSEPALSGRNGGFLFGFIRDSLIHSLAATKMIFLHRFHANPLGGNKERVAISQICVWGVLFVWV